MITSFLSISELSKVGFKSYGKDVLISRFARFYGVELMEIGNNVRIDDFCIFSGSVKLGNNIHISAFCALYASAGIELMDYSGLSPRCTLFSTSDDFGGDYLIGPVYPKSKTNVTSEKITLEKFTQLGANCVVMPGVIIREGAIAGAMSLINKRLDPWTINAGVPAKCIKQRGKGLISLI